MKLDIEITREDYADLNRHYLSKRYGFRKYLILLFLLIVLGQLAFDSDFTFDTIGIISIAIVMSVVAGLWFLTYKITNKWVLRRTGKIPMEGGSILGPMQMELNEEGLYCKKKNSESHFQWSVVKKLEIGKTAFYLFLDTHVALVLPKRSFKNEAEQAEFLSLIKTKTGIDTPVK